MLNIIWYAYWFVYLFWANVIQILCLLLHWIFVFLLLTCLFIKTFVFLLLVFKNILHIIPYLLCNLQIISPILWLVFIFLMVPFELQIIFYEVQFTNFFLWLLVLLVLYLRNHDKLLVFLKQFYCFSSNICIYDSSWINFCMVLYMVPNFSFCMWMSSFSSTKCSKKLIISPSNCLVSVSKINWPVSYSKSKANQKLNW